MNTCILPNLLAGQQKSPQSESYFTLPFRYSRHTRSPELRHSPVIGDGKGEQGGGSIDVQDTAPSSSLHPAMLPILRRKLRLT